MAVLRTRQTWCTPAGNTRGSIVRAKNGAYSRSQVEFTAALKIVIGCRVVTLYPGVLSPQNLKCDVTAVFLLRSHRCPQ